MSPRMPAVSWCGEGQACRMTWFITLSIAFLPYSLPANCTINNGQQSLPTTNQQFEDASQSASCSDTPWPARTPWLIYWSPLTAVIHFILIPPTFTWMMWFRWETALISSYNNIQARERFKQIMFLTLNKHAAINTKSAWTIWDRKWLKMTEKRKIKVRYCSYHGETRLHACTNSLNLSWGKWDVVPVEIHNTRISRSLNLILPQDAFISISKKNWDKLRNVDTGWRRGWFIFPWWLNLRGKEKARHFVCNWCCSG